MVAKDLENDDLVWAKMKGYPPWPGKIADPPKNAKAKKAHHYVLFYDSNNYAWIHDDAIELHSEALVEKYAKGHKRPPSYMNAVQLIIAASKNKPKSNKDVDKSAEESSLKLKRGISKRKTSLKKANDLENSSTEVSEIKDELAKSRHLGKNSASKEKKSTKKLLSEKEKDAVKKTPQKRSLSNDLRIGFSPGSPVKKLKSFENQKSDQAIKKKKSSKLTDNGKSPGQEKRENSQNDDSLDSDDEISRTIKDEIEEINSSANIQNTTNLNESAQKTPNSNDTESQVNDNKVAMGFEFEKNASSEQIEKHAEKSIRKRKTNESVSCVQNDVIRKKAAKGKSEGLKNKKSARSIRLGLPQNQKSSRGPRTSDSLREPIYEHRSPIAKGNNVHRRISNEDSDLGMEVAGSREFCNLLKSDRAGFAETVEDSEIESPVLFMKPDSPALDFTAENETLKLKYVSPTKRKVGFIGLGRMGQKIVKNLIISGHSVTVWNRTESKCDSIMGAEKAQTPSDLITACDIIFCCLANDSACKSVFFGKLGVASGLRAAALTGEKKGFVEMTTIDPETSKAISLEVNLKGGRYLEAQLSGSEEQATEGNLLIVAAGDKSLFEDCHSCFIAIAKTAMLVSDQVEVASNYNTIHTMLYGSVYAALAEALALVESIGLKKEVFINSFMDPNVKSVVNLDRNHLMGQADCPVNTPLMHVEKSLGAGLKLGSTFAQPMHVTAAANEVYKRCKRLKLHHRDISAVYDAATR